MPFDEPAVVLAILIVATVVAMVVGLTTSARRRPPRSGPPRDPALPAGWYPHPDGGYRWWTGEEWAPRVPPPSG
jgi:hypothetical protein